MKTQIIFGSLMSAFNSLACPLAITSISGPESAQSAALSNLESNFEIGSEIGSPQISIRRTQLLNESTCIAESFENGLIYHSGFSRDQNLFKVSDDKSGRKPRQKL